MKFILDASVALRWVLEGEQHPHADRVLGGILKSPEYFAIPELFGFEVLSVLARLHPEPYEAFTTAVTPVLQCGILRYPLTEAIVRRSFRFTEQGLTGYDAGYAALAEELGGCWITFDGKAVKKLGGRKLAVDLFKGLPAGWVDIF
jgi:predicted nucleic acid-binding protein